MPDPLSFKKSGITSRTSRDRARAHGTKVAPMPQAAGCSVHGYPHPDGRCTTAGVDGPADLVSASGGTSRLPTNIAPFKLGG